MTAEDAWKQPEFRAKYTNSSAVRRMRLDAQKQGRLDGDENPTYREWLAELRVVQARKGRRRAPRDPGRR